jgi:predicted lipoprotein with Yx(FWY)xxD motif
MSNQNQPAWRRLAVITAVAAATVGLASLAAMAVARTLTLQVDRSAPVTNTAQVTRKEAIVLNAGGKAVYDLTGDRRGHAECTKANSCFSFWPPVTVASARKLSKAAGIKGKLGTWHRNGRFQVTLNGHPLYTYAPDRRRAAKGEGISGFGGTWHVLRASGSVVAPGGSSMSSSTTTSSSSSPAPCLYPPC